MNKKVFSLICAISCSVIWGTSFVAQDMGMDYIGPYTFSASRLLLGFLAKKPNSNLLAENVYGPI